MQEQGKRPRISIGQCVKRCHKGSGLTNEQIAQLKQLGALHESDVLTDTEFGAAKQKILGV